MSDAIHRWLHRHMVKAAMTAQTEEGFIDINHMPVKPGGKIQIIRFLSFRPPTEPLLDIPVWALVSDGKHVMLARFSADSVTRYNYHNIGSDAMFSERSLTFTSCRGAVATLHEVKPSISFPPQSSEVQGLPRVVLDVYSFSILGAIGSSTFWDYLIHIEATFDHEVLPPLAGGWSEEEEKDRRTLRQWYRHGCRSLGYPVLPSPLQTLEASMKHDIMSGTTKHDDNTNEEDSNNTHEDAPQNRQCHEHLSVTCISEMQMSSIDISLDLPTPSQVVKKCHTIITSSGSESKSSSELGWGDFDLSQAANVSFSSPLRTPNLPRNVFPESSESSQFSRKSNLSVMQHPATPSSLNVYANAVTPVPKQTLANGESQYKFTEGSQIPSTIPLTNRVSPSHSSYVLQQESFCPVPISTSTNSEGRMSSAEVSKSTKGQCNKENGANVFSVTSSMSDQVDDSPTCSQPKRFIQKPLSVGKDKSNATQHSSPDRSVSLLHVKNKIGNEDAHSEDIQNSNSETTPQSSATSSEDISVVVFTEEKAQDNESRTINTSTIDHRSKQPTPPTEEPPEKRSRSVNPFSKSKYQQLSYFKAEPVKPRPPEKRKNTSARPRATLSFVSKDMQQISKKKSIAPESSKGAPTGFSKANQTKVSTRAAPANSHRTILSQTTSKEDIKKQLQELMGKIVD